MLRLDRSVPLASALAIAAITGWGAFAYSAISSRTDMRAVVAERDAAVTKHQRLEGAVGDLREVELKLGRARMQYTEAVQAWADARGKIGAAQPVLTKRVQQARDQVNQTGSIKQAEPAKRPAPTR